MTTGAEPEGGRAAGTGPPAATERVAVEFAGEGEGLDEMSWGMWEIWQAMVRQVSQMPIGGRAALEPGTTVEELAGELRYLMTRFPSMRTRLVFDAEGRPRQRLFAAGRTTLEVYDAAPDADADEVAAAVEEHYRRDFDLSEDWLVRMGAVRQHGRPAYLVTVMHHLVADALGGAIMLRQVRARDASAVSGTQQLEQARWQRSPAGQRQNERTLRHFENVLRSVPLPQLPGPTDERTPRHWAAEFRSPALTAALPRISARTGTGISGILLGLFALGLYRTTGISPVVVRPVVNNRFRSAFSDVVCMVAQAGICAIDVEGATAREVVERARRGSMSAGKHAYFDPEALIGLIERVSRERGADATIGTYLNNRSDYVPPPEAVRESGAEALAEELRKARGDTVFRWIERQDTQTERFFMHIDDTAEGGLRFEIRIDTHYVSPAQAEAFAYAMEAAAIEAAVLDADPAADAVPVPDAAEAPDAAGVPGAANVPDAAEAAGR